MIKRMINKKGAGDFKIQVYRSCIPLIVGAWLSLLLSGCGGATTNATTSEGSSVGQAPASTDPSGSSQPVVAINSPSSLDTYSAPSSNLTIAGSAVGNGSNITQITWTNSLGGSGIASGTTSWSVTGVVLQNGTNTITVTARDAAGNTGFDTLIVAYNVGATSRVTYYLSPTGNDANNGRSLASPWRSFSKAFGSMAAGDELILLDGTYSEAAGTGYISYLGTGSAQPPSGTSVNNMTYVHARNPGNVTIRGDLNREPLFIGRSTRKDSFIKIQGITFEGGGTLFNTSYVTVKDCGFHGFLGVGSNDHEMGNSHALLEDVWVWGNERIMLIVYRSDHVVVRRAVVRNDGCSSATADCAGNSGNAMVGTAIYNSHDVSFQNVTAIDNIIGPNGFGGAGDFMATWHNNFFFPWHLNEWLGSMSINTQLGASFYYDIDNLPAAAQPMATYKDIMTLNSPAAFAANLNCGSGCAAHNITVHNATFKTDGIGDGLWINSNFSNGVIDVKNIVAFGGGVRGASSPTSPAYMNVNGFSTNYGQSSCVTDCYTTNPTADGVVPSLKHPTRIENGSFLKGKGQNGADIGANIVFRYGADGTRHFDTGYNTLSAVPLWPWPNEDRIKREMCANTARGFCSAGRRLDGTNPVTLTSYIWEYLGTALPAGIYP